MTNHPIFTRYLYMKQDVQLALVGALLHNDRDAAFFWVYELYFSGFTQAALDTLWEIYYDFYAMLNPLLETYLKKKEAAIHTENDDEQFVGCFVSNLLVRKHTTDVFVLRKIAATIEIDEDDAAMSVEQRLASENYEAISHYLFDACHTDKERVAFSNQLTAFFKSRGVTDVKIEKKIQNAHVDPPVVLLARMMQSFESLRKKILTDPPSKKKNLYVVPDTELVERYRTVEVDYPREEPYKVYKGLVKYSSDHYKMLSLCREHVDSDIIDMYRDGECWLANAYQTTPIWRERITEYGGKLDPSPLPRVRHGHRTLIWENEDREEEFYGRYWYDTDEQSADVQHNCIPRIEKNISAMRTFHETHNQLGIYTPCPEVLECLSG